MGGSVPLKARTVEVVSRTVISRDTMRQEDQSNLNSRTGARGEAPGPAAGAAEARATTTCLERSAVAGPSMEGIVERASLGLTLRRSPSHCLIRRTAVYVIRTYGGVGGVESRDSPLSR